MAGKPSLLRVSLDEIGDKALTACILARAAKVRFPRPKHGGEVGVEYPLHFEPPTPDDD